jgi:hypothetical protein
MATPAFKDRPAPSVVYVATIRNPGAAPAPLRVDVGDDIKLYAGPAEVFVRVLAIGQQSFTGRVIGCNGHGSAVAPELAAGCEVQFNEKQIFTCSKRR